MGANIAWKGFEGGDVETAILRRYIIAIPEAQTRKYRHASELERWYAT